MVIDKMIDQITSKKNPCVVGLDPEWSKIPQCYKEEANSAAGAIKLWAIDVIEAVGDIVPAIKPQMAFFETFGAEGVSVHQKIVRHTKNRGLLVIDDSKRNDIGNTARAYAYAHLAKTGPLDADFLTVSPFLGTDSLQPFIDVALRDGKGLIILVRTSNPSSAEIAESTTIHGEKVCEWLANYINNVGKNCIGKYGYSSIGAVVAATFPKEAKWLRKTMNNNIFLVPGFGAQGGSAKDIVHCFNEDGLGAIVSSSRGILYKYLEIEEFDNSRKMYMENVRKQALAMQKEVYYELKSAYKNMKY